jgi:hypothetical protein
MSNPVNIDEFETPDQLAEHLYVWPVFDTPTDHAREQLIDSGYLIHTSGWKVLMLMLCYLWPAALGFILVMYEEWFGVFGCALIGVLTEAWCRYINRPRGNAFAVEAFKIVKQMEQGTYRARPCELSLSLEAQAGELTGVEHGQLEVVQ